ncbi:MAG TPA: hypothetical protein GXX18_07635 [Bacillales bacterium]|nr:hypothetical protein [Bacillales bacterium]
MINELHSLAKTLDRNQIHTEQSIDKYLPLRSKNCIRIWLSEACAVCGIEQLSNELTASLKTYGNDHNSFPSFNIKQLYRITDKNIIKQLNLMEEGAIPIDIAKLQSWCLEDHWIKDSAGKVNRSLQKTSQELLDALGNNASGEQSVVGKAIQLSFMFFEENSIGFKKALEQYIFDALKNNEERKLLLNILFFKSNNNKEHKNDQGKNIPVVIDVKNWADYGHPVASEATTKWVNQKLLDAISKISRDHVLEEEQDAFGDSMANAKGPMPLVMINGKQISLRTMFHEQLCQYRYQRIDDGSYPVSTNNRQRLAGAAGWIASPKQKGVTWDTVADDEVLFAYPTTLPEVPVRFTAIFGSLNGAERMQARFESEAKKFISVLRGMPTSMLPQYINIFIHKKTDLNATSKRGRIIFTHNSSPEQLIEAAENWETGCSNIPPNDLGERITPFPLQMARIVNNVWKQNGELAQGKTAVGRMKYYQGIELLLDILQESMVYNYLHILLANSSGLANYLGNWVHGGSKCKDKAAEKSLEKLKKETGLLLSILGLLLYKNNNRKENYMDRTAYLLGQVLKISDELHTLYCNVVRNGDVPPQLAGSALFVTAGEMPNQAIAQLSLRMNPYITWAKQYRFKDIDKKGEESWKAAWYLSLYESTANKLKLVMMDSTRFNDYDKAQLFIGYLSSFPKRENSIATTINNNENNMEGSSNEE